MKQLHFSVKLSILTCFHFIGIIESNSQSSCSTLVPKAPQVAIVTAGTSKKVCGGVNTVGLQAIIPNWINGKWQGGNDSDYSNTLNPTTTYTNTVNLVHSYYPYAVANHDFSMKIGSIENSPEFKEAVTSVFYPPNSNPNLIVTPTCPTCPNFTLSLMNSEHRTRGDWVAIDGQYINYAIPYSVCDGSYQIKVGVFGCQMTYASGSFVPTNGSVGCPPSKKKGFIEIEIEPIELAANRYVNSSISDGIGGFWAMGLEDGSSTFNTGTYTISTGFPSNNFDRTSITEIAPATVTVGTNTNRLVTRQYEYTRGRLTVALTSSSCNSNNQNFTSGAWSIDGINFNSSFATLDIPVGTYTVYFRDQQGYVSPQTVNVTVEGNKRTVVLGEYQKSNDFIVNPNICNNESIRTIEQLLSVSSNRLRSDYHCYSSNLEVCNSLTSTKPCTLDAAWNFYKSERNYQAPILNDFPTFVLGMPVNPFKGIAKLFTGNPTLSQQPLTNCQSVELPNTLLMSLGHINFTFDSDMPLLCPEWYNLANLTSVRTDPIAIVIDETNKCVINYTLPGHTLYPGKVQRCIYQECDKIYIKTTGTGLHFCGDNLAGMYFKEINEKAGSEIFINASKRYINDFKNR